MRVTNERAKWLKNNDSLEDIRNLSADLLEARELIYKQEATIKEMRKALSYIDCLNVNPSTTELSNTTRWSLASNKVKAILEKTKDYAE